MKRKMLVGAAICAASVMGVSGSVFAGEVTGAGGTSGPNGDGTTGMRGHANSECGFSGLEDGADNTGQPGVTQRWGQVPKAERDFLRSIGVSPAELCNGQRNPQNGD